MGDTAGKPGRDRDAIDRVLPVIYEELRRIAHYRLRAEQTGNTLETTGLVHEAYLRLVGSEHLEFESHAHFLAIAAQAMRHILIDSALARRTQKRGGGVQPLSMDAVPSSRRSARRKCSRSTRRCSGSARSMRDRRAWWSAATSAG